MFPSNLGMLSLTYFIGAVLCSSDSVMVEEQGFIRQCSSSSDVYNLRGKLTWCQCLFLIPGGRNTKL